MEIKKGYDIFVARVFLSLIFLVGVFGFLTNFNGTVGYISSLGVPLAMFFTIVAIIFKLSGSLMLLIGWETKIAAYLLITFTTVAILLAHLNFSDPVQVTQFLKNLAIIGGLILISGTGPGAFSLSKKR